MDFAAMTIDGVLTSARLHSLGYTQAEIRRLVATKKLLRLARATFTTPTWLARQGDVHQQRAAVHGARTRALLDRYDGRAAASHTSAAVLHGLPLWRSSLDEVHLTRTEDDHSRRRGGVVLHQQITDQPLVRIGGHRLVSVADAIVGVGLLDPSPHGVDMLMAADHALRKELTTIDQLEDAAERHAGFRGMSRVSQLRWVEPRHESPAETRLGLAARLLGLRSTPQVEHIVRGKAYRVDRELDDYPVVLEVDGQTKYGTDPAEVKRALLAQQDRENALRSIGLFFVRVGWKPLDDLPLLRSMIDDQIALSQARRVA